MNLNFMKDRPTLADMNARPRAVPKHELKTRLDEKVAKDKDADKAWEVCKKAVDARDGMRAEHHHLVTRREKALLHDPRNVLLVCLADHERLERNKLIPVQTAALMFAFAGRSLVNANHPLAFKKTVKAPAERT